jgi:hypothetical protein
MKIFYFLISLFLFTACTKINSFDMSSEFASFNAGVITSDNMSVEVNMNENKNFNISYKAGDTTGLTDISLSFSKDTPSKDIESSPVMGRLTIIDKSSMAVRYEPPFNFKGRDSIYAYIHHKVNGRPSVTRFEIALLVTNPNPESTVFINTLTVLVPKDATNHEFIVTPPVGQKRSPSFSFQNGGDPLLSTNAKNGGSVFISDPAAGKFKYTPPRKFVGLDYVTVYFVYLVEGKETISQFTVNFMVTNPSPDAAMIAADIAVETEMGVAKNFSVQISNQTIGRDPPDISFSETTKTLKTKSTASNGSVTVTDNANRIFSYVPSEGFRGTESVTVYLHQTVESVNVVTNFRITFIVKNPNPESVIYINAITKIVNKDSSDNLFSVATNGIGPSRLPKFSFSASADLTTIATAHGTVNILSAERGEFSYTPTAGYKGLDTVNAYFSYLVEGAPAPPTSFAVNFMVINPDPESEMVAGDIAIETAFGEEKTFNVVIVNSTATRKARISFDASSDAVKTLTTGSGSTLSVVDNNNAIFKYTPKIGFRGIETATVYLYQTIEGLPGKTNFRVTFIVKNPSLNGRPALALRGGDCTMCHANIKGNFITDGGSGTDTVGSSGAFGYGSTAYSTINRTIESVSGSYPHNYYALTTLLAGYADSGAPWGFTGPGNQTRPAIATGSSVIVPNVNVPAGQYGLASIKTLKQLIDANGSNPDGSKYDVQQKSKITIGAPDKSLYINTKFLPAPLTYNYFKEDANVSLALDGLVTSVVNGIRVFKNDPNKIFKCEGDLVLDGSLFLYNLNIDTDTGCRFYVSGTTVISGPINYAYKSRRTNIQITSNDGILHGLCSDPTRGLSYGVIFKDNSQGSLPGTVSANFNAVTSGTTLSCERNISHQSLLLNSKWVSSRYYGNFKGSIIAEVSLMSLGAFAFEYDSVFDNTPILPLVKQSSYLEIVD